MTPPLVGGAFTSNWNDLTVGDLFERIRTTMPLDNPGRLSRQQNADVIAFVLKANNWPAGAAELPADSALKQIRIAAVKPQGSRVPGARPGQFPTVGSESTGGILSPSHRRISMSRALAKSWLWSVFLSLLPATAFAQSAITGVVKDATGAVLVGVTVEAASDALIERVRAAVTDSQGVYRIVDLRPGTYAVTFSLQGFRGFKREDLELPSEFTATVNAELGLGAAGGVVTVTAELADGGHDDGGAHARARPRGDRPDSHRPHHSRHGAAHRRHQPEPARHRRRAGHAADLHEHARDVDRQQHRDGGRHARERAAGSTAACRATSTTR